MSKFLIIYAHPSQEGHHAYMLNQIQAKLSGQALEFDLIDLYALNYNPVLSDSELYTSGRKSVSQQNLDFQAKIKAADRLIFIYPTWWQNVPAILKGFFDRVFLSGFGFIYKNNLPVGLLKGKKAAIFTASGGPRWYSLLLTQNSSVRIVAKHILNFCGVKTKGFYFGSARHLDDQAEKKLQATADQIIKYLS